MRLCGPLILGLCLMVVAGCAKTAAPRAAVERPVVVATTAPATQPIDPIEPVPTLPAPQPATQPAQPPLDALELYARARDAQNQRQRFTAINLIEKALELDPGSFELNFALGRAYLVAGGSIDRAVAAL